MTKPSLHSSPADTTKAVDDFMRTLVHPLKNEIQAIRATTNLREKAGVGTIRIIRQWVTHV